MYFLLTFIHLLALARAGPIDGPEAAHHELAKPIVNGAISFPRIPSSGFSIFRRQGDCPMLTLVCPSGNCCSYDSSCCGSTCCDINSLCTGRDSSGTPCCVAMSDTSNTCGSSSSDVSRVFLSNDTLLSHGIAEAEAKARCSHVPTTPDMSCARI